MATTDENVATLMERTKCLPQLVADVNDIKLSILRVEDRSTAVERAHMECHATDLPALKEDMSATRTFRRIVCWGGGVIMLMLLSLWGAIASRVVAVSFPLK